MNNNYIHYKKNNINLLYLIISFSLIFFGLYKNGILLYKEFDKDLLILFRPVLYPIISLSVSCIFNFIKEKKINLNDNMIYILLLSLCVPINTGLVLFAILNIFFNLLLVVIVPKLKLDINYVALFKLIIIGISFLTKNYSYSNRLEVVNKYSYNLIDIFIGRGISGVCSSSILFIILGYFILLINTYYKKEIPLISFITYFIISLLFKYIFYKVIIFNSLIAFSLVFIAPLSKYSPAGIKERVVYSIILGILSALLTYFFNMYDGVIVAILISSLTNYLNLK